MKLGVVQPVPDTSETGFIVQCGQSFIFTLCMSQLSQMVMPVHKIEPGVCKIIFKPEFTQRLVFFFLSVGLNLQSIPIATCQCYDALQVCVKPIILVWFIELVHVSTAYLVRGHGATVACQGQFLVILK